jgi:hypothetical protein
MAHRPRNTHKVMETTTPFDLNQAIQQWRETLAQSPAFRNENLYELETHMRDSIGTLRRLGLSDEESLLIAKRRLGNVSQLESEFAKENAKSIWLDRALWILLGVQLWGLASVLSYNLQTILRASVPALNEWLTTYGFGRISETIPGQALYVIGLPLVLLASAKLLSALNHWTERRGWFPLHFILSKPHLLAGLYGLLCLLPMGMQYGLSLVVHHYGWERHSGMSLTSGSALYALAITQAAVFASIVWLIGRQQLRLGRS